jgi:broad specificity phosphatase PhoE
MLLLARHGETDWNREHKWQGQSGPALNQEGRRQARELAAKVGNVDAIYSSDTVRAKETAEIVAAQLGLEVRTDPRLREVHFGYWEGLTRVEINERFGGAFARWDALEQAAPNGGEADADMAARVLEALLDIVRAHPTERVLVVTSGGPIRAAQAHLKGIDQRSARRELETLGNCDVLECSLDVD